jgi:ribonuclease E
MLIETTHKEEVRVAVVENETLVDFDFENPAKKPLKGNVYLGKIVRIEPALQAAFVDYGGNRHGFLAFTEIHPDYFRIPVADRPKTEEELPQEDETSFESEIEEPVLNLNDGDDFSESSDEQETIDALLEAEPLEKEPHKPTGRVNPYRQYKIQEVIHSRQIVLVQVVKEERGNKGAALTTYVSLAGRYCVLMPNAVNGGGVSRRITDVADRKRLKDLIQDLELPEGVSLIVRTAGLDRNKIEIKKDYGYLIKLWSQIREQTIQATAPALIYEEGSLLRRSVRDMYLRDIEEIIVEGEEGYKEVRQFMKDMVPSHAKKVQKYKDADYPLFYKYKIERQIEQMHSMQVPLKSGGYIVINPTEALVAIDVNSGKAIRERHIDETAFNTNMEAAAEVARQIRLRDLAGLIVVDFIDMHDPKNNHQVERCLKEAMTHDRARVQVGRISQFGLLEMSRQRIRPSIMESSTVSCPTCHGAGFVRSPESFALQLLRVLEEFCLSNSAIRELMIFMPANLAFYLLSQKRHDISRLEEKYKLILDLREDNKLLTAGFRVEHKGRLVIDGLGNTPNVEEPKPIAKEEPKDKKSSKKQKGSKDQKPQSKQQENNKKQSESKPSGSSVSEGVSPNEPSDGEEVKKSRSARRRQRQKERRAQQAADGANTVSEAKETPQKNQEEVSKPKAVKVSRGEEKSNSTSEPQDQSSATVQKAPKESAPARKSTKGGWWQRLLDS